MLWDKFDEGAREAGKDPTGKPKLLQIHLSWAPTDEQAMDNALREWPNGGMAFPKQDIKNPEDFAAMAKLVRPEHFTNRCEVSSSLAAQTEQHPALRRHGLRRDPPPQRRAEPAGVHRGLRSRGAAEPPAGLSRTVRHRPPRRAVRLTRSRATVDAVEGARGTNEPPPHEYRAIVMRRRPAGPTLDGEAFQPPVVRQGKRDAHADYMDMHDIPGVKAGLMSRGPMPPTSGSRANTA